MNMNKISLVVLMSALGGCLGGGGKGMDIPTTLAIAEYVDSSSAQSASSQAGEQTQNVEEQNNATLGVGEHNLTEVVGDHVEDVNSLYGINGKNRKVLGVNQSKESCPLGSEWECEAYGYEYAGAPGYLKKTVDVFSQTARNDEYGGEYGVALDDDFHSAPSALTVSGGKISAKVGSWNSVRYSTYNVTKNDDGSIVAILRRELPCKGDGCEAYNNANAFKVLFGSDELEKADETDGNGRSDYTIWQYGRVDDNGSFVPTTKSAYVVLHSDSNSIDYNNLRGTHIINDKDVEFTGTTHAIKTESDYNDKALGSEELSGTAKLVFDAMIGSNLNYALTLDFSNWKKLEIIKDGSGYGYRSIVDNNGTGNVYGVNMNLNGDGTNNSYNKATGTYAVDDIYDGDRKYNIIGGFNVEATGESLKVEPVKKPSVCPNPGC